jgi:hypothetical protein
MNNLQLQGAAVYKPPYVGSAVENRRSLMRNMKTILIMMITAVACLTSTFAGQRFDAAAWRGVQTYDIPTLQKIEGTLIGQVVGVRINYRSDRISHRKPNWYESSIWHSAPAEKTKFAFLRVYVAKKDLPSFKSLPSDFRSAQEIVVYGQISRDPDANFLFIRLLGRNVTLDPAGNATVDW